jgi:hypothetical protein
MRCLHVVVLVVAAAALAVVGWCAVCACATRVGDWVMGIGQAAAWHFAFPHVDSMAQRNLRCNCLSLAVRFVCLFRRHFETLDGCAVDAIGSYAYRLVVLVVGRSVPLVVG